MEGGECFFVYIMRWRSMKCGNDILDHAEREPLGSAIEGRASTLLGQRKDLASPTIEINCYMIDVQW